LGHGADCAPYPIGYLKPLCKHLSN
jgi:hypothetical protein